MKVSRLLKSTMITSIISRIMTSWETAKTMTTYKSRFLDFATISKRYDAMRSSPWRPSSLKIWTVLYSFLMLRISMWERWPTRALSPQRMPKRRLDSCNRAKSWWDNRWFLSLIISKKLIQKRARDQQLRKWSIRWLIIIKIWKKRSVWKSSLESMKMRTSLMTSCKPLNQTLNLPILKTS